MMVAAASRVRSDGSMVMSCEKKFLYFARPDHPNDAVYAENVLEFCGEIGHPAREIIVNCKDTSHCDLENCIADAAVFVSPNYNLDHSCIGDRRFLDLAQAAGVPVIHWMLDHPSARWPQFECANAENSRFVFLSCDAEAYFKKFIMPGCRSGRTIGVGPNHRSRASGLSRDPFLAREIPALIPLNLRRLAGTCEEIAAQIEALPSHLRRLVAESIELNFFDLESPIESQVLSHGAASELLDNRVMLHKCVMLIEDAVQIKRRLRVFEVARNYPVLMQSDIASHHFSVTGPATLEENVSMAETNSRMQRSRAVVSVVHSNDEVHDRTLNGINAGSVNIIEDNRINRQLFRHGENALLFRYDDDSLKEALDLACFDPSSAFEIAQGGFALRDDPYFRFGGFGHLVTL